MLVGNASKKWLLSSDHFEWQGDQESISPAGCQELLPSQTKPSHLVKWCLVSSQHWLWARFVPKPTLFRGAGCRSNSSAHELFPCRKRNTQPGSSPSICIQKNSPTYTETLLCSLLWLWVSPQHCPSQLLPSCCPRGWGTFSSDGAEPVWNAAHCSQAQGTHQGFRRSPWDFLSWKEKHSLNSLLGLLLCLKGK